MQPGACWPAPMQDEQLVIERDDFGAQGGARSKQISNRQDKG